MRSACRKLTNFARERKYLICATVIPLVVIGAVGTWLILAEVLDDGLSSAFSISNVTTSPTTSTDIVSTTSGYCAPGYKLYADGGYCYRYKAACTSWQEARNNCLTEGADLLMLKTAKERIYFISVLENREDVICEFEVPNKVWIGATDADIEGMYKWVDGSLVEFDIFQFWARWQPDNLMDQDCLFISASDNWLVQDADCIRYGDEIFDDFGVSICAMDF